MSDNIDIKSFESIKSLYFISKIEYEVHRMIVYNIFNQNSNVFLVIKPNA